MPKLGETIETPTGEIARQRAGQQPFTTVTESSPLLPSFNVQSARVSGTNDGSSGNSTARQGGSPFSTSLSSALVAEIAYCTVSAGMILFNKHALSTFRFPAPNTLLLFQFTLAVALLKLLQLFRVIHLEPLRWDAFKLWAPLNLIFVAMNVTGFLALQNIGAGMFIVLKNLSNLLTIGGDWYFFGLAYGWQVWLCLFLMIISALVGGWTDLRFNAVGYAWQLANCCFTAAYSLYLSSVIKRTSKNQHDKRHQLNEVSMVSPHRESDELRLNELSMVYYNNVLSLPPLALLVLLSREMYVLPSYPGLKNPEFQLVAVLGGIMGFMVSFASIWCMSRTSPTIYSLTGSLNKKRIPQKGEELEEVVVALFGMWYFEEPTNTANVASIALGLVAGLLFVFAKTIEPSTTSLPTVIRPSGPSAMGSSPIAPKERPRLQASA